MQSSIQELESLALLKEKELADIYKQINELKPNQSYKPFSYLEEGVKASLYGSIVSYWGYLIKDYADIQSIDCNEFAHLWLTNKSMNYQGVDIQFRDLVLQFEILKKNKLKKSN